MNEEKDDVTYLYLDFKMFCAFLSSSTDVRAPISVATLHFKNFTRYESPCASMP